MMELEARTPQPEEPQAEAGASPLEVQAGRGGTEGREAASAMYLYGVSRARSWRGGPLNRLEDDGISRVRYRDLEALVRPVPFEIPPLEQSRVREHQRIVERAMRGTTVLPMPYGIVFRGRRALLRMLQDQYLVLDEGLAFLDGHWELRLHILPGEGAEPRPELSDLAMQAYSELRRFARAAVPFPRQGRRLLSAGFLVERASWLDFMERAQNLDSTHAELNFDITGPWPAYDFVRISRP